MEPTSRCRACGQDVPSGRFCALCGHPLSDQSPSPAAVAAAIAAPSSTMGAIPQPETSTTTALPVLPASASQVDTGIAVGPDLVVGQDEAGMQDTRRTRLSNRNVGIVATTLALLVVAGYLVFGTGGESHTVTGQLALTTASDLSVGSSCEGSGGYSDIAPGTQVILEDEEGSTLATSSFGAGTFDGVSCVFRFDFEDVPKATFYRVHQSNDRGVLQYSYKDMVDSDWSVYLTLGDQGED